MCSHLPLVFAEGEIISNTLAFMATLDKFYNHEPAKDNIIEEAVLIIVDLPQIVHQLKILQDDEKFHYVEKLMKSFFSITCKECS